MAITYGYLSHHPIASDGAYRVVDTTDLDGWLYVGRVRTCTFEVVNARW